MQVSNSDQTARHISIPSRSRRINVIKFKLRLVPIFGRSAAAQQNMPRCRLMRSHQRFSVLVAKYGATTNVLQPKATLGIGILLLTCVGVLYVAARSGLN